MRAQQAARQAESSPAYGVLLRLGLVAYGVVHIALAWVAGQLAWGRTGQQASQQGALRELGSQPLGGVLLWTVAIGLIALVLWQAVEVFTGYRDMSGKKRVRKRLSSAGRAAVYLVLGLNAAAVATGSGGSGGSGGSAEQTMTARLMSEPFGRVLVAGIGLAVVAVGVHHVVKAVTAGFTDDLDGGVGPATVTLGRAGYASKGTALCLVGVLFGWAAVSYEPDKAGGLDEALRRLRDQPAGPVLLTLIAAGIACFGVYCFFWAVKAKR
jgi:Domain of Unknown Function (DUF1206)